MPILKRGIVIPKVGRQGTSLGPKQANRKALAFSSRIYTHQAPHLASHTSKVARSPHVPLWQAVSTSYLHLWFGPKEWFIWTPKHIETLFYCTRGEVTFSINALFMSQLLRLRAELHY